MHYKGRRRGGERNEERRDSDGKKKTQSVQGETFNTGIAVATASRAIQSIFSHNLPLSDTHTHTHTHTHTPSTSTYSAAAAARPQPPLLSWWLRRAAVLKDYYVHVMHRQVVTLLWISFPIALTNNFFGDAHIILFCFYSTPLFFCQEGGTKHLLLASRKSQEHRASSTAQYERFGFRICPAPRFFFVSRRSHTHGEVVQIRLAVC